MTGGYVFLGLLLAHLLGDFPLQTDGVYALKRRYWLGTLLHAAIHGGITMLLLANPGHGWPVAAWVAITHFLVDDWKAHAGIRPQSLGFVVDQALHVALLTAAAVCFPAVAFRLPQALLPWLVALASVPAVLTLAALAYDDLRGFTAGGELSPKARHFLRAAHLTGWPLLLVVLFSAWSGPMP